MVSNSSDCSPPGSSVHGILQARILEGVAILFSRGSSRPRDQTHVSVSCVSCIGSWSLSHLGIPHSLYSMGIFSPCLSFSTLSLLLFFFFLLPFSLFLCCTPSFLLLPPFPPPSLDFVSLPITVLSSASSSSPSDLSLFLLLPLSFLYLFSLNDLFSPSLPHPFLFLSFFEFNTPCLYLLKYR